jgi:hypothetical protein
VSNAIEGPAPSPWQEFASNPASYAVASRVVACFDGKLPPAVCVALAGSPRLRERVNGLIRATHRLAPGCPDDACGGADQAIALAPADRLAEIARRSGAIFWSAAIANVIVARQVAKLHEQLGEEVHRFALAHRDLAGPPRSIEPIAEAAASILRDGWLCLGAWCHAQSVAVSARVRLKLPPGDAIDQTPSSPFAELGPEIVRRAAGG